MSTTTNSKHGLRGYIWNHVPQTFKTILEKHRVKGEYIELVYHSIPKSRRGNRWKLGISYLRYHNILSNEFMIKILAAKQHECSWCKHSVNFWENIVEEITNQIERTR